MGSSFGIISQTGNKIQTEGLIFYIDPAYKSSWSGPQSSDTNTLVPNSTISGSINNDTSGSYGDNNSFAFDGTDDFIQLSDTINLGTVYSISFWFKTTQSQTSNGCWLSAGSGNGFTMLLLRNNKIMLYRGSATDYNYGNASYNDGNWHNLTLTRNGTSTITMYLDTTDVTEGSAYGSGNLDTQLTFIGDDGGTWGSAVPYNGQLGPITFYNRALSASDVLQNYQAQKGRFGL